MTAAKTASMTFPLCTDNAVGRWPIILTRPSKKCKLHRPISIYVSSKAIRRALLDTVKENRGARQSLSRMVTTAGKVAAISTSPLGQALGNVTAISTSPPWLGQALGKRGQDAILSTADHRDTVLLVAKQYRPATECHEVFKFLAVKPNTKRRDRAHPTAVIELPRTKTGVTVPEQKDVCD
jgi:hypothetical protein